MSGRLYRDVHRTRLEKALSVQAGYPSDTPDARLVVSAGASWCAFTPGTVGLGPRGERWGSWCAFTPGTVGHLGRAPRGERWRHEARVQARHVDALPR